MAKTTRLSCLILALALVPAVAHAQIRPYRVSDPAVGERYHVEASLGLWGPTPAITMASTALSLIGTQIDAVNDLGFTSKKFSDFHLIVRPAKKHKIRFEYIPVKYSADATLTRSITFHGVPYQVGLPVTSALNWKTYRFGYEYDFLYRDRGFIGVIADLKYAVLDASVATNLASPLPNVSAATSQRVPIPGIGGIARGYAGRNVAFTGELTGLKISKGRYVDYDVYGTVNFGDNAGVQAGYRSIDVRYTLTDDSGSIKLTGYYFRFVARF